MDDLRLAIATGATCFSAALLSAHLLLAALAAGVALAALYVGPRSASRMAARRSLIEE